MERPSNDEQGLDAEIYDNLNFLENTDLRGVLDQEAELQYRLSLVKVLHGQYQRTHNPRDLFTAINHAQVIVRRLPASPTDKIEMLNTLSWMKMSAFFLGQESTGRPLLAESIAYARAALNELTATGSQNRKELKMAYDNLGQALSAKSQLDADLQALGEAISCGRQTVDLSETATEKAENSVNVAIRLHLRYRKTRQEADASEALGILTKNIETLTPGSLGHRSSLTARGEIYLDMYKHSSDLDILDKAIANSIEGLQSTPVNDDRYVDNLRFLGSMHETRYDKTLDISSLRRSADCYARAVQEVPHHPLKVDLISHRLLLLRKMADAERSVVEVDCTLGQAQRAFTGVPLNHAKYIASANNVSHILARRYLLSRQVVHFEPLVNHVLKMGEAQNKSSQAMRTGSRLDLKPMQSLQECIGMLLSEPVAAETSGRIFQLFSDVYKTSGPANGVINLYRDHGPELERLCRPGEVADAALEDSRGLTVGSTSQTGNVSTIARRPKNPPRQPPDPYTDPITGMRHLAMAPGSGTVILSMEGIVRDLMGYDPNEPDPRTQEEFLLREITLESKALARETSEGKNPNPRLCRVCRRIEHLHRNDDGTISWNTKLMLPHGNWNQLRCRASCQTQCRICNLILSLLAVDPNNPTQLHHRLAKIDPEVQGTQFEFQELDNGEVILGVKYGLVPVGALRIVESRNRDKALRHSGAPTGDEAYALLSKYFSWIMNCEIRHGKKCSKYLSDKRCQKPIPLVFIDVTNHCLVRATSAVKYFALSYVWGGPQTMATKKSNVESRFVPGSLAEQNCHLPQTIRDAMLFVSRIGEQYLWVDSMCIVQDDTEDMERDIHRMDIVYMMAFATIAAAHGKNANAGLPGLRPGTRPAQRTASLSLSPTPEERENKFSTTQEVMLTTTPSPLLFALEATVWETRGWVQQEKMLSRRCIFFTSNWVYFQCGQDITAETALEGRPTDRHEATRDKSPRLQENPLTILAKTGLVTEQQRLFRAFEAYTKLVDIYVCCELTEYDDIINAFTGILGVLEEHFAGGFISALPTSALDLALLWAPGQKMLNRTPYVTNPKDSEHHKKPYFPSWSWAGWVPWVGRPGYRLFDNLQPQPLPTPMIDVFCLHHHGIFHSIMARGTPVLQHETKATNVSGPDFGPSVLQFWAETAEPAHFPFITNGSGWVKPEQLSLRENVHTTTSQAVIRLQDRDGRHCGLWYDNKNHRLWWAGERQKEMPRIELVAVSRLVAERICGPYRVEGEISMFDGRYFPDDGEDGGVVNCLVVEWYEEIAARVTVAQIHSRAWKGARPRRKHIRLF
ncbi:Heterokaryon incompatibility protein (HET) domain containing protein [Naviculisporaceae sp. PSN 640]